VSATIVDLPANILANCETQHEIMAAGSEANAPQRTHQTRWTVYLCVTILMLLASACQSNAPVSPAQDASPSGPRGDAPAPSVTIRLSAEAARNAQIVVQPASASSLGPRLEVPATIEGDAQHISRMGTRVPGRVVRIRVSVGQHVLVGDPLLDVATVELHQVTTEYLIAVARARLAQESLRRARALSGERVGSTAELQRAQAEASATSATLHEAEEHLHFLGLREGDIRRVRSTSSHGQSHSIVRAQTEGTVTSLSVSIGQVLQGTEEVIVISRIAQVWAKLHLYERDLPRVLLDSDVTFRVSGLAEQQTPRGRLSFISELVDPVSHTIEGRVSLDNPQGRLRIGMTATALIALPNTERQLWLPQQAVQSHEGHSVVFVQLSPNEFVAREVTLGDEQADRVAVLSGVSASDMIVVQGAFLLRGELERDELEED
jgi:cobalt-zinc-cadmium efflux system membrane fusion protein